MDMKILWRWKYSENDQAWTNCAPDARSENLSKPKQFFWRANFAFQKRKKASDLQIYSRTGRTMRKIIVNSKYYRKNQCTFNILMFITDGVKIALSTHGLGNIYLFQDGGPYHIETSPLICSAIWFLYDRDLPQERINCMR